MFLQIVLCFVQSHFRFKFYLYIYIYYHFIQQPDKPVFDSENMFQFCYKKIVYMTWIFIFFHCLFGMKVNFKQIN